MSHKNLAQVVAAILYRILYLHQQAFHEYVLVGRLAEEVARELGISPGTVYAIKSRIHSRLRQELQQLL